MALRSGSLTHRIRIERRVAGKTPSGGASEEWEPFATIWAGPSLGTGQERREAAQTSASAPATLRVRRSADTREVTAGGFRARFDPLVRMPTSFATLPIWDIKSAVPFGADAIDLAVMLQAP